MPGTVALALGGSRALGITDAGGDWDLGLYYREDALPGCTAGVPTYLLTAELALGRVLYGTLPTVSFPPALAAAAPHVWRFCRSFSIDYARVHATRGNPVGAVAQAAKAVMEEGHAVMCAQGRSVCNEKRLIDDAVADRLGVPPGDAMPWNPRA